MTDATPPQAPAAPGADAGTGTAPETSDRGDRIGTILMGVAISLVVVLVADVALKGRLLAPLFALLPAPKPPLTGEPDAETRPAGE